MEIWRLATCGHGLHPLVKFKHGYFYVTSVTSKIPVKYSFKKIIPHPHVSDAQQPNGYH